MTTRQLAAVLFTDIVGYTQLMGKNEQGALQILDNNRSVQAAMMEKYNGRLVKELGDGTLAWFQSALEAVRCARAIQLEIKDALFQLRIGIHLGDVILQNNDIFGNSVNIASRVMALAPPGGVAITEQVLHALRGNPELAWQSLGRKNLRNVAHPVGVYLMQSENQIAHLSNTPEDAQKLLLKKIVLPEHTLVGRQQEQKKLMAALEKTSRNQGQFIGVVGEPGIGKTILVEHFLAQLSQENPSVRICRGRCSERLAGTEAYLPFLEMLEDLIEEYEAALKQWAPSWYVQLRPHAVGQSEALAAALHVTQERLKREFAFFVQSLAEKQVLIIFLDDLHWADASSTDLLAYLVPRTTALKVLLLTTFRPFDMILAKHPFLTLKPELESKRLYQELKPAFLSTAQIAKYLDLEFPRHLLPDGFTELLQLRTEGNPLFMVDLVDHLRHKGYLTEINERWNLSKPISEIEVDLPNSINAMVQKKIDSLSEDGRRMLSIAAVQGYDFDTIVIAGVLSLREIAVESKVSQLANSHGLIRIMGEKTYPNGAVGLHCQFVHVLYQNGLYDRLLPSMRIQLNKEVAHQLLSCHGDAKLEIASTLATLFAEARQWNQSLEYYLAAAQQASGISASGEAGLLAKKGLAVMAKLPEGQESLTKEINLLTIRGSALAASQSWVHPEVKEVYERAFALCQKAERGKELGTVLWGLAFYFSIRSEHDRVLELFEQMNFENTLEDNPDLYLQGNSFLGQMSVHLGDFEKAKAAMERGYNGWLAKNHSTSLNTAYLSVNPLVLNRGYYASLLIMLGYPDQALASVSEAIIIAEEISSRFSLVYALLCANVIHTLRGEHEENYQQVLKVIELADQYGFLELLALGRCNEGHALVKKGNIHEGLEKLRKGVDVYLENGSLNGAPYFLTLLADAYCECKMVKNGLEVIEKTLAMISATKERWMEAELLRLKGECLFLQQQHAEAEIAFQQSLELARQQNAKWWELRTAISMARHYRHKENSQERFDQLSTILDWFSEGFDSPVFKEGQALFRQFQPRGIPDFVGRKRELKLLRSAWREAGSGKGSMIGIAGEPGIGKTTFVEDFLSELSEGAPAPIIARGQCSERLAGMEAYLPFLEILEDLIQDEKNAILLRQLAPSWYVQLRPYSVEESKTLELATQATQERRKKEMATFLKKLSQHRPAVFFIDDLHWADASSTDLLAYLAPKWPGTAALLITTYRPADMKLVEHPFLQIKSGLLGKRLFREIALSFLETSEIEQYLQIKYPGNDFTTDFARRIHQRTEGSPLFMADLIQDLEDNDLIVKENDKWKFQASQKSLNAVLPGSITAMVERKIGHLNAKNHKLLSIAAVQGYEFNSAIVARLLHMDEQELEERLEKIEKDLHFIQLIGEEEFPDGIFGMRYRFVHALYQNQLYRSLSPSGRKRLCKTMADQLLEHHSVNPAPVANELAKLYETARDYAQAASYYQAAATLALQRSAFKEAELLAKKGLNLLPRIEKSREVLSTELGLVMCLANSIGLTKGWAAPGLDQHYKRAEDIIKKLPRSNDIGYVLFSIYHYFLVSADFINAESVSNLIWNLAADHNDEILDLLAHVSTGYITFCTGNLEKAKQMFSYVIPKYNLKKHKFLAFQFGLDLGVGSTAVLSVATVALGYPDKGTMLAEQSLQFAKNLGHPNFLAYANLYTTLVYDLKGDFQKCWEYAERTVDIAAREELAIWLGNGRQMLYACQSEYSPTEKILREYEHTMRFYFSSTGTRVGNSLYLYRFAKACFKAGKLEKCLEIIEEAVSYANKTKDSWSTALLFALKGDAFLTLTGNETEAEKNYEEAIALAQGQKGKWYELQATIRLARLWQQQGKVREPYERLKLIYDWFTEGFDTVYMQEANAMLAELKKTFKAS